MWADLTMRKGGSEEISSAENGVMVGTLLLLFVGLAFDFLREPRFPLFGLMNWLIFLMVHFFPNVPMTPPWFNTASLL